MTFFNVPPKMAFTINRVVQGRQGAQDRLERLRAVRERPRDGLQRPLQPRPAGHLQVRGRPQVAQVGPGLGDRQTAASLRQRYLGIKIGAPVHPVFQVQNTRLV